MQDARVTVSNDWADFTEPSALPSLDYFHHDAQSISMENWTNDAESQVQYEDLLELTPGGENYQMWDAAHSPLLTLAPQPRSPSPSRIRTTRAAADVPSTKRMQR